MGAGLTAEGESRRHGGLSGAGVHAEPAPRGGYWRAAPGDEIVPAKEPVVTPMATKNVRLAAKGWAPVYGSGAITADPHVRWRGRGRLDAAPYPILDYLVMAVETEAVLLEVCASNVLLDTVATLLM